MFTKTATLSLSLAALVASVSSISSSCQAGISSLDSEASSCLAVSQLSNIILTSANSSVILPVQNWLNAFCAADVCSNSTITSAVTNLTTACASDLTSEGLTDSEVSVALPYIVEYFSLAKEVICLADEDKSEYCAVELGTDVENSLNTKLSLTELVDIYSTVLSGTSSSSFNTSIVCTTCTQGALVLVENDSQLSSLVDIKTAAATVCGSTFASVTTMPSNIAVATGSSIPKGISTADSTGSASTLALAGSLSAVVGAVVVAFLA